jgi:hypothetical protein
VHEEGVAETLVYDLAASTNLYRVPEWDALGGTFAHVRYLDGLNAETEATNAITGVQN